MIKERLKRLVSVIAATAVTVSALSAPIGADGGEESTNGYLKVIFDTKNEEKSFDGTTSRDAISEYLSEKGLLTEGVLWKDDSTTDDVYVSGAELMDTLDKVYKNNPTDEKRYISYYNIYTNVNGTSGDADSSLNANKEEQFPIDVETYVKNQGLVILPWNKVTYKYYPAYYYESSYSYGSSIYKDSEITVTNDKIKTSDIQDAASRTIATEDETGPFRADGIYIDITKTTKNWSYDIPCYTYGSSGYPNYIGAETSEKVSLSVTFDNSGKGTASSTADFTNKHLYVLWYNDKKMINTTNNYSYQITDAATLWSCIEKTAKQEKNSFDPSKLKLVDLAIDTLSVDVSPVVGGKTKSDLSVKYTFSPSYTAAEAKIYKIKNSDGDTLGNDEKLECGEKYAIYVSIKTIGSEGDGDYYNPWVVDGHTTIKMNDEIITSTTDKGIEHRPAGTGSLGVWRTFTIGHDIEHVEKVEETCTKDGTKEHWKCSACDKLFSDKDGKTETTSDNLVIPACHKYECVAEVSANCVDTGVSAHYECTRTSCGKKFTKNADDTYKEVSDNELTIPVTSTNHKGTLIHHEKVDATCIENGCGEYWECTACNNVYTDENGTKKTTLNELEISVNATNHEVELTHHAKVDATCIENGCGEYWECTACNNIYTDENGTKKTTLKALEIDKSTGSHDTTLTRCDGHKAPTCTEDGYGEYYKCERCGQLFSSETDRTATIGSSTDDKIKIDALGHDLEHHDAKAASCTEDGNKEYWQCKRDGCGKYFLSEEAAERDNSVDYDTCIKISAHHTYTNDAHPNGEYVDNQDDSTHRQVCVVCKETKSDCTNEAHEFEGNKCEKCGYTKPVVTTTTTAAAPTPESTTTTTTTTTTSTTTTTTTTATADTTISTTTTSTTTTPADTTTTADTTITTTTPVATTTTTTTTTADTTTTTTTSFTTPIYYIGPRPNYTTTTAAITTVGTTAPVTTTSAETTVTTTKSGNTTTPPEDDNDDKPFIKGSNGKNGWDAINGEVDNAKKGGKVYVDMNGTTNLPKNVLENLKGKDVTIILDIGDGFTWEINGKDITDPRDLDLAVSRNSGIPVTVVNALTGELSYITISLEYSGEFGCKATLTVDMGEENSGYWTNLYYYNNDGAFEFTSSGLIDENGNARLTFYHASEYVIIIDDHDHGAVIDVPAASESNPHTGVVLSFSAVTLAAAVVLATKKKNK